MRLGSPLTEQRTGCTKGCTHDTRSGSEPDQGELLPTISIFYGVVIQMFAGDHPPPHFMSCMRNMRR